jgi:aminoglycoside phosphotransferase (APT) family kinase protein
VAAELGEPDLAAGVERATALTTVAAGGPAVVCHGDFHPLNVMVDGDRASVIDWTDAGLGPREADVSRTLLLFHIAAIAAGSSVERVALRVAGPRLAGRYRRAYEAGTPLDPERLRAWGALHSLHGWSQVRMLHAGGFDGASSSEQGRIPLEVGDFLQARFEAAVDCHTP